MKVPKRYTEPFFDGLDLASKGQIKIIKELDRMVWIMALAIREGLEKRKKESKRIPKFLVWYLDLDDPKHLI